MDKNKLMDKLKDGISIQELEDFTRKYTTEVFSILALIVAAVSTLFDFFTGARFAIFFASLGALIAACSPVSVELKVKQFYSFCFNQEKTTEMILGGVKIIIALFVPFIYFGFLGLLAGVSYHHHIRHTQVMGKEPPRHKGLKSHGNEHD